MKNPSCAFCPALFVLRDGCVAPVENLRYSISIVLIVQHYSSSLNEMMVIGFVGTLCAAAFFQTFLIRKSSIRPACRVGLCILPSYNGHSDQILFICEQKVLLATGGQTHTTTKWIMDQSEVILNRLKLARALLLLSPCLESYFSYLEC